MFVTELVGYSCSHCFGKVGVGVKEEPSGWKVYAVCMEENRYCTTKRVGTISRSSVSHIDEMNERAEKLVKTVVLE